MSSTKLTARSRSVAPIAFLPLSFAAAFLEDELPQKKEAIVTSAKKLSTDNKDLKKYIVRDVELTGDSNNN